MAIVAGLISLIGPWIVTAWISQREPVLTTQSIIMATLNTTVLAATILWRRGVEGQRVSVCLAGLGPAFLIALSTTFIAVIVGFAYPESWLASAALTVALAVLTWLLGAMSIRAPRNRLLGFRTPRTLASDEAWIRANHVYGRRLQVASIVALVGLAAGKYGPLVALLPAVLVGLLFLFDEWQFTRRDLE